MSFEVLSINQADTKKPISKNSQDAVAGQEWDFFLNYAWPKYLLIQNQGH